jgi:hypothetical protein
VGGEGLLTDYYCALCGLLHVAAPGVRGRLAALCKAIAECGEIQRGRRHSPFQQQAAKSCKPWLGLCGIIEPTR